MPAVVSEPKTDITIMMASSAVVCEISIVDVVSASAKNTQGVAAMSALASSSESR
jgi:hypothetical protein